MTALRPLMIASLFAAVWFAGMVVLAFPEFLP